MTAKWVRSACALVCGLGWAFHVTIAHAADVKVLFVAPEATPFSARARAEIEAMGFEIVTTDVLDAQGRSLARAAAYVVETPPRRRVELWLQNQVNGRLELNTIVESRESDSPVADDALETVRASEQLRAFFEPLRAQKLAEEPVNAAAPVPVNAPPTPTAVRAPSQTTPPIATGSSRFFEELALALPIEPGSAGVDALVRGAWRALPRLSLAAKLGIPVLSSTLRSRGNSASLTAMLLGSELSLLLVDASQLKFSVTGGVAIVWLRAAGQASAPYTSRTDHAFRAMPGAGAQVALPLNQRLRLCLNTELGVALPKLSITFANQPVAVWGHPFGLLSAGVGIDL